MVAQTQKVKVSRIFVFGVLIVSLMSACANTPLEPEEEEDRRPYEAVLKLDKNVAGLRKLAEACMSADSVAVFHIEYNEDRSVLYWLSMKAGGDIELFSEVVSEEILIPELSMNRDDGVFYWTVNGAYLLDSDESRIAVTDYSKAITFLLYDDAIRCEVNNTVVGSYPVTKAVDYLARDVSIDYDLDNSAFNLRLSSGFRTVLPTISEFHLLEENVQK